MSDLKFFLLLTLFVLLAGAAAYFMLPDPYPSTPGRALLRDELIRLND